MRPPEEVRRHHVRQWWRKAEEDFGVAEHLLAEDTPFLASIGFHAQQAAEKLLKAILVARQIEFPKTHDLGELLDLVVAAEPGLPDSLREIVDLNAYSVTVRYPGDFPDVTPEEASVAVRIVADVRDVVRELLRRDLGPDS